jgi:hypothetical protein
VSEQAMPNHPWVLKLPDELEGFGAIRITPFYRDDQDWIDPKTGEVYPATMQYYANMTTVRLSDDTNFFTRVSLDKDILDWPPEKQQAYFDTKVAFGIAFLETFRDCACKVGKPCMTRHGH